MDFPKPFHNQLKMPLATLIRSILALHGDDLARFTAALKHYIAFRREIEPLRDTVSFRFSSRPTDLTIDGCLQEIDKCSEQDRDDLLAELEAIGSVRTSVGHSVPSRPNWEIRGNMKLIEFERVADTTEDIGHNILEDNSKFRIIYHLIPPTDDEPSMHLTLNFSSRLLIHRLNSFGESDVFWSSSEIDARYRPLAGISSAPSHATLRCTSLIHPENLDRFAYDYRHGNLRDLLQAAGEDVGYGTLETDVAGLMPLDEAGITQLESFVGIVFAPAKDQGHQARDVAFMETPVRPEIMPSHPDAAWPTLMDVLLKQVTASRRKRDLAEFRKLEQNDPRGLGERYGLVERYGL